MREIAMLPSVEYPEQFNVRVEPDLKERIEVLRKKKKVDVAEEARRMLRRLVGELEAAVK